MRPRKGLLLQALFDQLVNPLGLRFEGVAYQSTQWPRLELLARLRHALYQLRAKFRRRGVAFVG